MDEAWAFSFLHLTELYLMFPNVMDLGNFFPNENNPFVFDSWIAKLKCNEYIGKPIFIVPDFVIIITVVWIQNL
jgi:hypothetical protein